ncbi:MAG: hypothetical protein AUG48_06190 [Actinobacteria bacterium 13_1_20CM_3_68_9]|jgi:uncharacterized protein YbcI|nr:MAG: hypothetical protein AUG48_06190 [Actinobacteria bacterium 13_1_20CM_3_68_9]
MTASQRESQGGDLRREISRALVELMKETTGRGPGRARTYINENVIVTLLRDTMTKAERTLLDEDKDEAVRDLRRLFQGVLREQAIETVQRITGRKVLAFLSDHALDPDYAIETFILEPGLTNDGS